MMEMSKCSSEVNDKGAHWKCFRGFRGWLLLSHLKPCALDPHTPDHCGDVWTLNIVKTILFKQQKKTLSSNKTYMQ